MRFLLFHTRHTDDVQADLMVLREVRGLDVLAYQDMRLPSYRQQGFMATPLQVRESMVIELVEGRVVLVHPDTEPSVLALLVGVCRWLHSPVLRLAYLPAELPTSEEARDMFFSQFTAARFYEPRTVHLAKPLPAVDIRPADVAADGTVIEPARTPREWMRAALRTLLRWEDRFNRSAFGRSLKNPTVRALRDERPRGPKPYKLNTRPPLTTG